VRVLDRNAGRHRLGAPITSRCLPIPAGGLVVALINASVQPFTDAVLEVELRDAQGSASTSWFSISAVPGPDLYVCTGDIRRRNCRQSWAPHLFGDRGRRPGWRTGVDARDRYGDVIEP
jgi:hypothetical protein